MNKLPYSGLIYWLAMLSCFLFIFGGFTVVLALAALILSIKSQRTYAQAPDEYNNIGKVNKAKIIAIIGLVLNVIILGVTIWTLSTIGWDAWSDEFVRKWNEGLENGRDY
ncbi:hypothetical protein GTQ48_05265 [Alteromonas genovensis]|uniref:DUF4190 domain-containing protein n=1 Tax=Alteromonas genovensis TaxID=471225 RepID=A0A6N9THD0_9ALTE|nr:CCC motif membrane protein [Alteromonas genovensis]NDW14939.1 hypothetical protein [Alteromonas genovensis]